VVLGKVGGGYIPEAMHSRMQYRVAECGMAEIAMDVTHH
jgi:hypothetical protein